MSTNIFTEEHRRKLSESRKGRIPWNKGKKGVQICSEETRKKLSKANSGVKNPMFGRKNPHSEKWKKHHSEALKGKKHSEETKLKMSLSQKGHSVSKGTKLKI